MTPPTKAMAAMAMARGRFKLVIMRFSPDREEVVRFTHWSALDTGRTVEGSTIRPA